jgi:hypothetical protein
MGVCALLMLYAAVGQRLGYPLRLVVAHGDPYAHFFVRWDQSPLGPCFNVEASNKGLSCPPDDYYRTGVYATTQKLEHDSKLLQSLTPRQCLGEFLMQRGWRWMDHRNYREATNTFAWACSQSPGHQNYLEALEKAMNAWRDELMALAPAFPPVALKRVGRYFPASLDEQIERDILNMDIRDILLKDPSHEETWWGPLRQGKPMQRAITCIHVVLENNQWSVRFETRDKTWDYDTEPIHV